MREELDALIGVGWGESRRPQQRVSEWVLPAQSGDHLRSDRRLAGAASAIVGSIAIWSSNARPGVCSSLYSIHFSVRHGDQADATMILVAPPRGPGGKQGGVDGSRCLNSSSRLCSSPVRKAGRDRTAGHLDSTHQRGRVDAVGR